MTGCDILTILSCSFSSSRCISAAVSGLGCRIGPLVALPMLVVLLARGDVDNELFCGMEGGPITAAVLCEARGLVDCVAGSVFRSGGGIVVWD